MLASDWMCRADADVGWWRIHRPQDETTFSINTYSCPPLVVSVPSPGTSGPALCPPLPYIISHFPFSKTAPSLSPPLISPLPRQLAGPLPPFPLLHLHLGSTRLPKCFLGVRWLIGSHLLGERGLYGILGNLCQEFYHIDLVCFPPCSEFTHCSLSVFFILVQQMNSGM